MIGRRSFLVKNAPAAALASSIALSAPYASAGGKTETAPGLFFEFVTSRLQMGEPVRRYLGWLEKRALPLFQKHRFGPMGFFTIEVGPYIPAVFALLTYPSLAEMEAAWKRLADDADWGAALADLEKEEPAFYRQDSTLLIATPFSPPLNPAAPGEPRHNIFELRIYESPTHRQLGFLHDRFAGGEIALFHMSGIHPVLYADALIGPNRPNMAYLTPFESEAHREKAWAAFRNNPEWLRLRDESIRRGGEIVRNVTNMILTPTSFSMLR